MEAFVRQALRMTAEWRQGITVLILVSLTDIKFQLKEEMERPEIRGLTDNDHMHDILPKLNQFNSPLLH